MNIPTLPEWANLKQLEGMRKFYRIASEYGDFVISFKPDNHSHEYSDDSTFYAILDWNSCGNRDVERHHEMLIGFDYESTWDRFGDPVYEWQFIFGDGDATREMTSEVFFLDLFFYLDGL